MSAQEPAGSTAATLPRTGSHGDLSSSLPEAPMPAPRESDPLNEGHIGPEAPPPPQIQLQSTSSNLPTSMDMAVLELERWTVEQQNLASASHAAGSPSALTTAHGPNGFNNQQPFRQAQENWLRHTLSSMGIGRGATPARKSEMSLVWNLCWGLAQVVIVSTLTALSGTIWRGQQDESLTEWQACDKPLGVWACLWVARVVLASGLAYWDFVRTRAARQLLPNVAITSPGQTAPNTPQPIQLPQPTYHPYPRSDPENPASLPDSAPPPVLLPWSHLYSRLTLFSSLFTLSWFLTAHILQYTSLNSCRHTSPHLWWLIFGILCIMYVMVLEVLLLGFIVLVLAPILFVFWNIFLFCIGRHPAQNPHLLKPEVGKLSKSLVDRIPLVIYIPPPPDGEGNGKKEIPMSTNDIEKLPLQHEYPPKSPDIPTTLPTSKKSRFRFFKRKPVKEKQDPDVTLQTSAPVIDDSEKEQETWEGNFEKSEHPFVVLEGNRAVCAICLMDFEEPPKRKGLINVTTPTVDSTPSTSTAAASTSSGPASSDVEETERENHLKLADAGEGAQPLRLLACGHVFHQTCLDPWLTDVSGRCPICQRAVEARELRKKKRRNR